MSRRYARINLFESRNQIYRLCRCNIPWNASIISLASPFFPFLFYVIDIEQRSFAREGERRGVLIGKRWRRKGRIIRPCESTPSQFAARADAVGRAEHYTVKSKETRHPIPPRNVLSDCPRLGPAPTMENDTSTLYPAPFKTEKRTKRKKKPRSFQRRTTGSSTWRCTCERRPTSFLEKKLLASLDSMECRFVNRSRVVENGTEGKSDPPIFPRFFPRKLLFYTPPLSWLILFHCTDSPIKESST